MAYPDYWQCPYCKEYNRNNNKCKSCSFPRLWHCPKCKETINDDTKCANCGFDVSKPNQTYTITKADESQLKQIGIAIVIFFYVFIVMVVVFSVSFNDLVTYDGSLVVNRTIGIRLKSVFNPTGVEMLIASPSGLNHTYTADYVSGGWEVANLSFSEYGIWKVTFYKEGTLFFWSKISKTFFIGLECGSDSDCANDQSCQEGECEAKVPGMFDFMGSIGI